MKQREDGPMRTNHITAPTVTNCSLGSPTLSQSQWEPTLEVLKSFQEMGEGRCDRDSKRCKTIANVLRGGVGNINHIFASSRAFI